MSLLICQGLSNVNAKSLVRQRTTTTQMTQTFQFVIILALCMSMVSMAADPENSFFWNWIIVTNRL